MAETKAGVAVTEGKTPDPVDTGAFRQLTILLGAGTVMSGILGIVGLYFGIALFSSYKTMAFSSAIIWVCFGLILAIHAVRPLKGIFRTCVALLIAGIAVIAVVDFSLSLLGKPYLFEPFFIHLGNSLIGYPTTPISPVSAGIIIPAAIALLLMLFPRRDSCETPRCQDIIGSIGLFVSLVSFTFILSYLYGAPFLYNSSILPMAFMSALGGLFLGVGIMMSRGATAFPLRYITGSSLNARLLRTFLPLTLVIIFFESFLNKVLSFFINTQDALTVSISLVVFSIVTVYAVTWAVKGVGGSLEAERRERKRAEDALQQVNKKLNLLSSITRHDINNQLFSVKAFLELSKETLEDSAQMAEYLIKIEQATNAIEHQIAFTRDYEDMGVKAPSWQNIEATLKEATSELPMRGVKVTVNGADVEVYADALLKKVFYNLLENALRYGGTGLSEIRISSRAGPAGALVILVEDNGVGITPEDKRHIFSRGFGKNTGLGLFLSSEILSITNITIQETSEPGNGARFEIHVPQGAYRFLKST